MHYRYLDTPIGPLLIAGDHEGLREIRFPEGGERAPHEPEWVADDGELAGAAVQLSEYFAGRRRGFELALAPRGTRFQRRVWRALEDIPHGRTLSYGELARAIGKPKAARAVGGANARNPLPIVIPCHRVIGASGALTGFGGGLAIKQALLDLERTAGPRAPARRDPEFSASSRPPA